MRVPLQGLHQLRRDAWLHMGRWHVFVGEVQVCQRLVVEPYTMDRPNHPVTEGLRLFRFRRHVFQIVYLVDERSKSWVGFPLLFQGLCASKGERRGRFARAVPGRDNVLRAFHGTGRRPADHASFQVDAHPVRKQRFDHVRRGRARLQLRLQEQLAADDVVFANARVRKAGRRRRLHLKGDDRRSAARLIGRCDDVRHLLDDFGRRSPYDASARVALHAIWQRRLYSPCRGTTGKLGLQLHILAHVIKVVDHRVLQLNRWRDDALETELRRSFASLVFRDHLVCLALLDLYRFTLDLSSLWVDGQSIRQRRKDRELSDLPFERGLDHHFAANLVGTLQ
mmetsp:Transcript_48833/g.136725  ORF Transcript_48833/g.136725 Transcript_48833/m.136725 type:complete len:338 (+) Transcript_48833:1012-2025(+)